MRTYLKIVRPSFSLDVLRSHEFLFFDPDDEVSRTCVAAAGVAAESDGAYVSVWCPVDGQGEFQPNPLPGFPRVGE